MKKKSYVNVLKSVYLYTRDNAINGVWQYCFRLNGVAYRGSTGVTDVDEAKMTAIHNFQLVKTNPNPVPAKKLSFQAVAHRWLEMRKGESDYVRKEEVVRRFLIPFFEDVARIKDVGTLTQAQINDYVVWRRNYWVSGPGAAETNRVYQRGGRKVKARATSYGVPSNSTLTRENNTLRAIICFALDEGTIRPTTRLSVYRLKDDQETRPEFTLEQADRMCRLARERAQIDNKKVARERRQLLGFVVLLRYTGMRPGEVLSLTWQDINLDDRLIYLRGRPGARKTGTRVIPLVFPEAIQHLKTMHQDRAREVDDGMVKDSEHIFVHPDGKPLLGFKRSFVALVEACGFEKPEGPEGYSAYSFRHSYVTTLGRMGMPDSLQAKALGTSREMIGAHYDHNTAFEALRWADAQHRQDNRTAELDDRPSLVADQKQDGPALEIHGDRLIIARRQ